MVWSSWLHTPPSYNRYRSGTGTPWPSTLDLWGWLRGWYRRNVVSATWALDPGCTWELGRFRADRPKGTQWPSDGTCKQKTFIKLHYSVDFLWSSSWLRILYTFWYHHHYYPRLYTSHCLLSECECLARSFHAGAVHWEVHTHTIELLLRRVQVFSRCITSP